MTKPTKLFFASRDGKAGATTVSSRVDCRFALIGNFKGEGFRVISIHKREELADPSGVHNANYSDVQVAYQN